MKKLAVILMMALATTSFTACTGDDKPQKPDTEAPSNDNTDTPDEDNPDNPGDGSNILVAYFSWGGTTQRMAQEIVAQTGADIFRIEPVTPYPTEYTPCTEVARAEENRNCQIIILSLDNCAISISENRAKLA